MKWTFWTRTQPLTPDDCGTIEPLLSLYADGMASAEEAQRVETHLPDCPDCRASLAWMQATQRALASRPIVSPPDDLRARIASAIAASSAVPAPVSFDVRRAYARRSVLAAAASLTILGIFVSYSVLHQPQQVAVHPVKRSVVVATGQPFNSSSLGVKPGRGFGVKTHITLHPRTVPRSVRSNPELTASLPPDETTSERSIVKTPAEAKAEAKAAPIPAPVISLPRPRLSVIRKPGLPKFKPELMAINKHLVGPVETHKAPAVKTEANKPETVVATTAQPAPPVPVNVGAPTIKQDPTPTAVVASNDASHTHGNNLLSLSAYVGQMKRFTHATIGKAEKGAVYTSASVGSDRSGTQPLVGTDLP